VPKREARTLADALLTTVVPRSNKNTLRQVFLDHPKSAWIDSIPVYAQFKTYPVNLAGALHIAQRCARI